MIITVAKIGAVFAAAIQKQPITRLTVNGHRIARQSWSSAARNVP
jgi:hypothetical protein